MSNPDEEHVPHGNVFIADGARAAVEGVDLTHIAENGRPVVVVTRADMAKHYDGPLPHKGILDNPDHPDRAKLDKALTNMAGEFGGDPEMVKAFRNPDVLFSLLDDKASAAPQSGGSSVCVVVAPENPSTLLQLFNSLAHIPSDSKPQLGPIGARKDPGVILAHEFEHCDQSPVSSLPDHEKPNVLLHHEHGADSAAFRQFPQESRVMADARALGSVHVGLRDGSNQHSTPLVEALGGKISYSQVESTYQGLGHEIAQRHVNVLLRTDPGQLRGHLAFALKKEAESLEKGPEDSSLLDLRQALVDAKKSPAEVLGAIPEALRSGVQTRLTSLVGQNMKMDPVQIAPLLRDIQSDWKKNGQHDPASTTDPTSVAVRLYLAAAEQAFPEKAKEYPSHGTTQAGHRLTKPTFRP